MCDYSLHSVTTRDAVVGDRLRTTLFRNTVTRGLCDAGDAETTSAAVCLRPGTELRCDVPLVEDRRHSDSARNLWRVLLACFLPSRWGDRLMLVHHRAGVATFRKIRIDVYSTHHDALEMPDGQHVTINSLVPGQYLEVLQVPVVEGHEPAFPAMRALQAEHA
jgi:hypothetical protein